MTIEGTIQNGVVVLDTGARLANGTQLIADIRESIEDMKAGRTRPAREVLKDMALRLGISFESGE